jgi:tetratricopeptide (TPR) repeat protein
MTEQPPASLAPALDRLRLGDRAGARAAIDAALAREPDAPALLAFAGLLAAQSGDPAAAAPHFRRALALDPQDLAMRVNLATALAASGARDEAAAVCAAGPDDPRLARLAAYLHQESGRLGEAAAAYEGVIAAFPKDFESWNNLGNVRAAMGDPDGAADAFQRAIALRPDIVEMVFNLSEVLAAAGRDEERRAVMRAAVAVSPDDVRVQTELGLAESTLRDFEAAERAYREAIRLDPRALSAHLELGLLLENLNRTEELAALVEAGKARGLAGPEFGFIEAWSLRRQGRFAEALPLALATPESIHPVRRNQLIAELHDRLGDAARAFAAFEEMNRASVAAKPVPAGPNYRETVAADAARLTPERVAAWTVAEVPPVPPSPVFIVGFPRSGTTLLDTLLMNMPSLHVLEELPVLREVEASIAGETDPGRWSAAEVAAYRARYFEALDALSPPAPGRIVVDKHPLHMARMGLVHRLFPDARIIFVERHPCDAVLSCFMSNFNLNHAMRSFTDLGEAASTYDIVFDAWTRAEALLPLKVHRVRYERMVEDLDGEMRALLDFLGLPWDEAVLDNRAAAASRGHVRTASYAQVTEPIYKRAAGRWERYRTQLAPVLPILAPWAERLGYPPLEAPPSPAEALEKELARAPAWAEGHVELARQRWAAGDRETFARSFEAGLAAAPGDTALWRHYLASLMYGGRHEAILEAAARGRAAAGAHPLFDLAEAVAHDDLGDLAAAAPRFERLAASPDPAVAIYRVRHLLRAGRHDEAAALAQAWLGTDAASHFAPYLATAWRLTGDPRLQWLEGDERLVGVYDLGDQAGPLAPLADLLRAMHEGAGQPLDQSVRGGSQAEGPLSRADPPLVRAREAIMAAVARHVAQLPPVDPAHPVLRHRRDSPPRLAGSWTVRLSGRGHHVAHVHPEGWLSSAFYVALPDEAEGGPPPAGWLALGQPPAELGLDLAPLRLIEPKPGRLVLFPATMWHATMPFAAGERLTIAFDVAPPEDRS